MTIVTACGIAVADIIAADLPKISPPGKVLFTPVNLCIGGHPCNVSIDLVQMGISPSQVNVVISIGRDPFGDFIRRMLKSRRIIVDAYESDKHTSRNIILVVKGEDRRFHVDVGANEDMDPSHVLTVLKRRRPKIFYVGGTGMLGRFDERLEEVCKFARGMGCTTFLDIISPYGKNWDYILPALRWTDIFHCNDIELMNICGRRKLDRALEDLTEIGVGACIVTMGEKGALASVFGRRMKIPAFKVKVVDPTGAGDAFCAGIIFMLITKYRSSLDEGIQSLGPHEWEDVLRYASACGAASCTAVGTTTAVRREVVEEIYRKESK